MDLRKKESENERQYIWRLCRLKEDGLLNMDWQELSDIFNKELREDESQYYNESAYRKPYQYASAFYDDVFRPMLNDNYIKELDVRVEEIQKERCKLNTSKIEYNKWLRENAREELFLEQIIDSIKSVDTEPHKIKPIPIIENDKEYCLCIADSHFGKDFKIYGLNNEVINSYSPEIFYERMEKVLFDALKYIEDENITSLKVFNLGDSLDGFLRNSQIWTLRYGVVDSAIIYGKYMAEWFKRLSEKVRVEYHPTSGNHAELRLLDGLKGEHLHEDIEKIVNEIIAIRNEDNPNFSLISNKTGLIFTNIAGYKILGIHGEIKNPIQAIKDFADIYNTQIDMMVTGHKHHGNFVNCGFRKQVAGIGSIVGTDDFSVSLRKQADATANVLTFEYGKGLINNHIIVLN